MQTYGVEPDIMVTGKGLSGGIYPIAAALIRDASAGWLHEYGWGHVSTFGGSELGCRVARTVLEITQRPATTANVRHLILTHISRRYREKDVLKEAKAVHPNVSVARDLEAFQVKREERG